MQKNKAEEYYSQFIAYLKLDNLEILRNGDTKDLSESFDKFISAYRVDVNEKKDIKEYILEKIKREKNFYWERYFNYLKSKKTWSDESRNNLENDVKQICSKLNFKKLHNEGAFQLRSLVMGDVQSGKTAVYTGICAKAVDAGYKVILVLTTDSTALRMQTQQRLDQELVGFGTDYRIKDSWQKEYKEISQFGPISVDDSHRIRQMTMVYPQSAEKGKQDYGDFNKDSDGIPCSLEKEYSGQPILLVCKKNNQILIKLINWLKARINEDTGKIESPLLLIDDEADAASVTTNEYIPTNKKDEEDEEELHEFDEATNVNHSIRKLLFLFSKAAYVGVTATPFANIFSPRGGEQQEFRLSDDLYPKDFIYALTPSSDYIGPEQMFLSNAKNEYIVNPYIKEDLWAGKFEKDNFYLPSDLKDAIRYFILVRTIMEMDNICENSGRTMLIHVSRAILDQNNVKKRIFHACEDILTDIIKKKRDENQIPVEHKKIKDIWTNYHLNELTQLEFDEILDKMITLIKDAKNKKKKVDGDFKYKSFVDILVINSDDNSSIDREIGYAEHLRNTGKPYNVIAIGGDRLSRGLTLQGLFVSYFDRNVKTEDTLLQMGRWFGRPIGYKEFCKVWITKKCEAKFTEAANAIHELKKDFRDTQMLTGEEPLKNHRQKVMKAAIKILPTRLINQIKRTQKNGFKNYEGRPYIYRQDFCPLSKEDRERFYKELVNIIEKEISKAYEHADDNTIKAYPYVWKNVSPKVIQKLFKLRQDCVPGVETKTLHGIDSSNIEERIQNDIHNEKLWDIVICKDGDSNLTLDCSWVKKECPIKLSKRNVKRKTIQYNGVKINYYKVQSILNEDSMRQGLTQHEYKMLNKDYKREMPLHKGEFFLTLSQRNPSLLIMFLDVSENGRKVPKNQEFPLTAFIFGIPGKKPPKELKGNQGAVGIKYKEIDGIHYYECIPLS